MPKPGSSRVFKCFQGATIHQDFHCKDSQQSAEGRCDFIRFIYLFSSISTAPLFHIPETCFCTDILMYLVNIHLHTAVSHGHGVVGQSVTGHLTVIGAADRGERAHVAGVERVSFV